MNRLYQALHLKRLHTLKQLGFDYTPLIELSKSSLVTLPDTIEPLKKIVASCHLCDLGKSRTKSVFGEGNPEASLMFVGEGPGAQEDLSGRPFVGRAGEQLTKMIENVLEIDREEVYIANIVKCHPPNNRVPTPQEAHTCLPYLQQQIAMIRPKVIVPLGATAFHYLTGDQSGITKVRGQIFEMETFKLVPTYHPSYLLRNPSAKKEAYLDLLKIKSLL